MIIFANVIFLIFVGGIIECLSYFTIQKLWCSPNNRPFLDYRFILKKKPDVKKEIEATLAAKKSEQMIMSLMPAGIIMYLQMTSPGFLSVLYGNPFGIAAMSICLVIYATAYWLGRKIVDIEV